MQQAQHILYPASKLDNTKRASFQTCPRKFYWQHVRYLRPDRGSTALRYGSTWHKLLETYYALIKQNGWDSKDPDPVVTACFAAAEHFKNETSQYNQWFDDYRTIDAIFASFQEYLVRFADERTMLEIVAPERPFKIKIQPETPQEYDLFDQMLSMHSEEFYFTGIIDLTVRMDGHTWIREHKTTSQYIAAQAQRLHRATQIIGYIYASRQLAQDVEGALVTIHHLSSVKSRKTGDYGPLKIDFQNTPYIFTSKDLREWRLNLIYTHLQICKCLMAHTWPMQMDSCYTYGQCAYNRLCEQNIEDLNEIRTDGFILGEEWDVSKGIESHE